MKPALPDNLHELQNQISSRHLDLSKRLKQVAEFVLENPNVVALETVSNIASAAGVHPSTLIRFAAAFGYEGFSEMQQLFRDRLVSHSINYRERVRKSYTDDNTEGSPFNSNTVLSEMIDGGIQAAEQLPSSVSIEDIDQALGLLEKAKAIHVVGVRRSYPIASYLVYALRQIHKKAYLIDGTAAMHQEHANSLVADEDLLIAISYTPYAQETRSVLLSAYSSHVPIISISDSRLSPLLSLSNVFFEVRESEVRGIRSLSASLILVQSLVIAFAGRLELSKSKSLF